MNIPATSNVLEFSGDLFSNLPDQFVIAHIVNNSGKWGAGFSGELSKYNDWPEARYRRNIVTEGTCQFVKIGKDMYVANMVAQHGTRSKSNPTPIRYSWLGTCLTELKEFAEDMGLGVYMPKIGSGLAGGEWPVIKDMIGREFKDAAVTVNVYTK